MVEQLYWDDVEIGSEVSDLEPMNSQRVAEYCGASYEYSPFHYDAEYCARNNVPGVLVHGVFKGVACAKLLHGWAGKQGRVVRFGNTYRGMDTIHDDLTVWARVTRKYRDGGQHLVDLDIGVVGRNGAEGSPGTATVALPSRGA